MGLRRRLGLRTTLGRGLFKVVVGKGREGSWGWL